MTSMGIRLIFFIALAIISFGCSGVRVLDTEADAGFKLSQYQTFDFFKLEASGDTTENFEKNANLMKQSISRELQSKGLRPATGNPDLLVNIGIVVNEQVQTRETTIQEAPRYMGQRRYRWKSEEVEVGKYREGTVTVDLVDPASDKMVWKGVVEGIIPRKEEQLKATIDDGVRSLFEKL